MNLSLARIFLLIALTFGAFAGCKSVGEPESGSHASLRFTWPSLLEIQRSVERVLGEQGFRLETRTGEEWVFDRPGTTAETLKWSGLDGKRVVMRAKLKTRPVGPGEYLIECDVFVVNNPGEKFFEEETRLTFFKRSDYQKLLEESRRRLESRPAS